MICAALGHVHVHVRILACLACSVQSSICIPCMCQRVPGAASKLGKQHGHQAELQMV